MPSPPRKVFGIGFHKTGTTSLGAALTRLGHRVTGPNWVELPDIADRALALATELSHRFDAFQDNPWPLLYREMDALHPGSKFVLTVRDPDRWLASAVRHFGARDTPMREWIYGVGHPAGNEDVYRARYVAHNFEVQRYFAGRPNDLLVMDLSAGDGWPELCAFLGCEVVPGEFPRENVAAR